MQAEDLSPYLGFIASFSQWFGLSIVIGVISYIIVPFIRDVFFNLEFYNISEFSRSRINTVDNITPIYMAFCLCKYYWRETI